MKPRPVENLHRPKRNLHLLSSLRRARCVAKRLARRSHALHRLEVGGPRPVIWLQAAARNAQLNGVPTVRRVKAGCTERVLAAPVEGCLVK